jgi:hypothetical protein
MARKTKKKARKSKLALREWALGQPLAFPKKKNPTDVNRLAREVVEAAIGEMLIAKPYRRKKPR